MATRVIVPFKRSFNVYRITICRHVLLYAASRSVTEESVMRIAPTTLAASHSRGPDRDSTLSLSTTTLAADEVRTL